MRACLVFLVLLFGPCLTVCPAAVPAGLPASLPPLPLDIDTAYARASSSPGREKTILIAVLRPHAGYHAYAHHGAAPRPTRIGLIADGRAQDATVRYPLGTPRKDAFSGDDVDAYSGPVPIFLSLPTVPEPMFLRVSLLLCSAAHCIPVDTTLPLPPLPASLPASLPDMESTPWAEAWKSAIPGDALTTPPPGPPGAGPDAAYSRRPALPVLPSLAPVPTEPAPDLNFSPRPADVSAEPGGLGAALLRGLLAGLILNVMPCVFPVLTLKMLALLGPAGTGGDEPRRLRRFREHNLLFAAGVLTWFTLLACAVSLLGLTWGGLFQYAGAVTALAGLTGLLGLSMLDLCTLPVIDLKPTASASPRGQAYLAGLTATLLATPCSGPLLGGVLAWSAAQPPLIALLVFLGVGCGMALPYLLFAARPSAVALLPRSGPWLAWVERGVGVFLLAATFWLLLILPRATALVLAAALLALALFLILRRARRAGLSPLRPLVPLLLCGLSVLWVLGGSSATPAPDRAVWEPFTPGMFSRSLGREPVLLEFTADWCPNCKALEWTTLTPERLRDWQRRYRLRLIRVDMTAHDPEHEALLRSLGSISIPLTAVFPAGGDWRRPLVLRDLYTPAGLERVLAGLGDGGEGP